MQQVLKFLHSIAASEIEASCGHVRDNLRSKRLESSQSGCARVPSPQGSSSPRDKARPP